jgi:hypothetical protein
MIWLAYATQGQVAVPLAGHRGACPKHMVCEIHIRGYCKTQLRMSDASFMVGNLNRAAGYCNIVASSWVKTCGTNTMFRHLCVERPPLRMQLLSAPVVDQQKADARDNAPETVGSSGDPLWVSEVNSPSPPPPQTGLACSNDRLLPLSGLSAACVLAATAMSSTDPRLDSLEARLEENCKSYRGWLHILLNYHDGGGTTSSHATRFTSSCIATTQFIGFKTLFWKHALQPITIRRYTHLWLFDSDLDITTSAFALPTILRIMHTINVRFTSLEL